MKVPQNYMVIYPKCTARFNFIAVDAYERKSVNDEFYGLKKYLRLAFEKCSKDYDYCEKWLTWLNGKESTLLLRELFKSIGCDYWADIYNGNVIDRLDSLQCRIKALTKN